MYQKERLDSILKILQKEGYVTVKYLTSILHYSNATINRDLNILENRGVIKRTYGGVELVETKNVRLPFRYHLMKSEKIKICQQAAELIEEGDVIFLDGSTTCEYMFHYLTGIKDIKVITNNIALALHLSEYGVEVICLGGKIIEKPSMCGGIDTVETAMKYKADKMFFATNFMTENGEICVSEGYYLMHKTMLKNSKKVCYLLDHKKVGNINNTNCLVLCNLSNVDYVVSDYDFDNEFKEKFKKTKFIKA
jgi:DeoR/GlpR family transcriptional regulator of sugar metabolism